MRTFNERDLDMELVNLGNNENKTNKGCPFLYKSSLQVSHR